MVDEETQQLAEQMKAYKAYVKEKNAEYRKKNKDIIKQKNLEYREKNYDKIKENKKQIIKCECGAQYQKNTKSSHMRTAKHIKKMNSKKVMEDFNVYRKSDEYAEYFAMIKADKPDMNDYLINLCLYGYWYEDQLEKMDPEERKKYPAIIGNELPPDKIPEPLKGDLLGVSYYKDELEYMLKNPDVRPVKTIGEEFKLEEALDLENIENSNEIIIK